MTVHENWYFDWYDNAEHVWRMDFSLGDDAFQIQVCSPVLGYGLECLPAASATNGEPVYGGDLTVFVELDNRDPKDPDLRTRYAIVEISPLRDNLHEVLEMDAVKAVGYFASDIRKARAMPSDPELTGKSATGRP